MARRHRWAVLAALLLVLPGCWDRTQLEDQAYVISLGLDRAASGALEVTAEVAGVQELSIGLLGPQAQRAAGGHDFRLLTAEADTIIQGIHVLNGGMTRRLDLRHLRAVVVGEELSRAGLEPVIMELLRNARARGTAGLFQARGRARDVLAAARAVVEANPGRVPEGLLLQGKYLHLAPPARAHHFLLRLAAPGGDPFLPVLAINPAVAGGAAVPRGDPRRSALPGELPRTGGNPVEFAGTAIFRRDRLQGYLTVDETQMLLALRGEMGKAYVTIPDPMVPGRSVSLRLHQENLPRYRASLRGGRPHVQVNLMLEAERLAAPGGVRWETPGVRQRLESATAEYTARTAEELLRRLRTWGADPVGFGHLFRSRFPSWRAWQAYGWRDRVQDMKVTVAIAVRIRRYGLMIGPDRVGTGR